MNPVEGNRNQLSFFKFLEESRNAQQAKQLLEAKDFESSIKFFKSIENLIDFERQSFSGRAWAHYNLGRVDSSLHYLKKAFQAGLNICNLQESYYSPIWEEIVEIYPEEREKYLQGINLDLRKRISEMDIADQTYRDPDNHQELRTKYFEKMDSIDFSNWTSFDKIVQAYGWPGQRLIGHYPREGGGSECYNETLSTSSPILLVLHMPKSDQEKYLDEIFKSIELNETTWGVAYQIKQNLLWDFREGDHNLYDISFLESGKLDTVSSAFELRSIAVQMTRTTFPLLKDNILKEIYPEEFVPRKRLFQIAISDSSNSESLDHYRKSLTDLKELFVNWGVPDSCVQIDDKFIFFDKKVIQKPTLVSKRI